MKAPATCRATSARPITPAAHGAARTSRFLLHCRGRQARSSGRTEMRFAATRWRGRDRTTSSVNRRLTSLLLAVASNELMGKPPLKRCSNEKIATRSRRKDSTRGSKFSLAASRWAMRILLVRIVLARPHRTRAAGSTPTVYSWSSVQRHVPDPPCEDAADRRDNATRMAAIPSGSHCACVGSRSSPRSSR